MSRLPLPSTNYWSYNTDSWSWLNKNQADRNILTQTYGKDYWNWINYEKKHKYSQLLSTGGMSAGIARDLSQAYKNYPDVHGLLPPMYNVDNNIDNTNNTNIMTPTQINTTGPVLTSRPNITMTPTRINTTGPVLTSRPNITMTPTRINTTGPVLTSRPNITMSPTIKP
jgi:hypothetical protein